jgi:hypothetical protein
MGWALVLLGYPEADSRGSVGLLLLLQHERSMDLIEYGIIISKWMSVLYLYFCNGVQILNVSKRNWTLRYRVGSGEGSQTWIRQVLGLNHSQDTGYPDSWDVLQWKKRDPLSMRWNANAHGIRVELFEGWAICWWRIELKCVSEKLVVGIRLS